jgi:hypothetical protein
MVVEFGLFVGSILGAVVAVFVLVGTMTSSVVQAVPSL